MAFGGLLALLDDITILMDDVAAMSKVAATKTAGIVGDDLAVNAHGLIGIDPKRELPIVWKVAKGSFWNKCLLVPAALILSVIAAWLITPLLMIGGAYLCYEGAEKVLHAFWPDRHDKAHHKALTAAASTSAKSLMDLEKEKIDQAIKTDFILSAEIVAVTLGTVKGASFALKAGVLSSISLLMTVVVYGLVAGIVKLDDLGLHLATRKSRATRTLGNGILRFAPYLMKTLSVVGTLAMFAVGGGIILHGIPPLGHLLHDLHGLVAALVATAAGAITGGLLLPVAPPLAKRINKLWGSGKTKYHKRRQKKRLAK